MISSGNIFTASIRHFQRSNIFIIYVKHWYRFSTNKNPYDVLGLKSTCSSQEVKTAYIKLCKDLHPDKKPGDESQHQKFIELQNAYTTLINSESRKQFDAGTNQNFTKPSNPFYYYDFRRHTGPFDERQWDDTPFYEREDYKRYFYKKNQNVRPIKRNKWITLGCFLLLLIGSTMYIAAYSYAKYKWKLVDSRSRLIHEDYVDIRNKAKEINNEDVVDGLKKKWNR